MSEKNHEGAHCTAFIPIRIIAVPPFTLPFSLIYLLMSLEEVNISSLTGQQIIFSTIRFF
jgi:hypothetical protein